MDDVSLTSLRIFCYLSSNINRNTGATRIVSIPQTKKAVRSFRFIHTSIDGNSNKDGKIQYEFLEGGIGDVFVFSADKCLHAATSILTNQPRDMLELVIDFKQR
jgi:hypothetical protein